MKRIALVLAVVFPTAMLHAQRGPEIIREAMRRTEAWKNVSNVNYTSLQISYNKWQSYDYYHPTGNKNVLWFSYDLPNSRYLYTIDSYYGGGYHFSYVNIGKDSVRYSFDRNKNRDGKKISKQGKAQYAAGASFLQQFIPYYLLKNLSEKNDSFYVAKEGDYAIIRRNLKQGGVESFHFNTEQQLMKQVTVQRGQQIERVFRNYKNAGGLVYASIIDNYVNGILLTQDSLYNISIESLKEDKLQLPADYTIDTTSVAPKVISLSRRAYLIENVPGGRNMVFVKMNGGIFITEAPLSSEVSQAMINIIHKTLPGIPIKYVHLSHFHNDHTNGIRAFAAEGATIVASEYTAGVLRSLFEDTSARLNEEFAALNKTVQFLSVTHFNEKVGKEIIQLYEMENNHAKGMSFVYLPKEKLIYQGDLYSLPGDGTITPAIEITQQFYRYLKRKNITPSRIIGHHGHSNITPAILKTAVLKNKQQ